MNTAPDTSLIGWTIAGAVYAIDLIVRLWLLFYIPKNRRPTAANAWLLLIFALPMFGTLLFFLIGNTKLSRSKQKKQAAIVTLIRNYTERLEQQDLIAKLSPEHTGYASLIQSLTGFAPTTGNDVEIISGYQEIIDEMISAVNRAEQYVYVEFFALALDQTTEPFFDALAKAKKRGVDVYVLYDLFGSRKYPNYKQMKLRLDAVTTSWSILHPLDFRPSKYNRPDLRNHRKILVVDGTDAFIGSLNMIHETYHRKDDISYIELVAQFKGPVVNEAAIVFAGDWHMETDEVLNHFTKKQLTTRSSNISMQILPSGPAYPYENNLKLFVATILGAKKSVSITNPYLVPDDSFLNALVTAALGGVEVSILNSEAMDQWMVGHAQRSYYEELLQAGVKIHLYIKPQLVHEKFITIDDELALVGSSNFDIRSFALNDECMVVAYDTKTAKTLRKRHEELKKHSKEINLAAWQKRSVWKSFLDSIARLTSALQ